MRIIHRYLPYYFSKSCNLNPWLPFWPFLGAYPISEVKTKDEHVRHAVKLVEATLPPLYILESWENIQKERWTKNDRRKNYIIHIIKDKLVYIHYQAIAILFPTIFIETKIKIICQVSTWIPPRFLLKHINIHVQDIPEKL